MSIAGFVLDEVACMKRSWDLYRRNGWEIDNTGLGDYERAIVSGAMTVMAPDRLEASALCWISPEMVQLLKHAAKSLPPYVFRADALPWPSAVVVSSTPLLHTIHPESGDRLALTGFQWTPLGDADGPWFLTGLSHYHGAAYLSPFTALPLQQGRPWDATDSPDGHFQNYVEKTTQEELASLLCALWLLVQQKIAVRSSENPSRSATRRWMRDVEKPIPQIQIIRLRKEQQPANLPSGEPGFVEWSHRWIVDGHWRNQFHPSIRAHIPTWIAPHVKGPANKPLIVKQRVNAWVR